LDVT
jgi:hypothetical protein